MRKKIEAVGNIEAILPDCVSIESDHKRRGRDTIPYTEPGPTTSGLVTKLQKEAEEAYRLLERALRTLERVSVHGDTGLVMDVRDHVQTYEERYRKQGGGQ